MNNKERYTVKTYEYHGPYGPDNFIYKEADDLEHQGNRKAAVEKVAQINNGFKSYLGRELKKEETKGKRCIRIYYKENGEIDHGKVYGPGGYFLDDIWLQKDRYKSMINFKTAKKTKIKNLPPYLEKTHESVIIDQDEFVKQFAGQEKIKLSAARLSYDRNEVFLDFSRIPASLLDLYILDRESTPYLYYEEEIMLYADGFKLTERTEVDPDGIVSSKLVNRFNTEGIMVKQEIFLGTLWGELYLHETIDWFYDVNNRRVIKILPDQIVRYILTDILKIQSWQDFTYQMGIAWDDEPKKGKLEGFILGRDFEFDYDEKGRVAGIRYKRYLYTNTSGRITYKYDEQGRIINKMEYNGTGKLQNELITEYIDSTHKRETWRYYPADEIYKSLGPYWSHLCKKS